MSDKYAELRALAQAATPGPREVIPTSTRRQVILRIGNEDPHCVFPISQLFPPEEAAYIAAASPAVVLDLLADLDRARAENKRLREALGLVDNMWTSPVNEIEVQSCGYLAEEMALAARAALEESNA